jgi:hypothetical protein
MKIPHTMRHTFSTTALEHGMDIKTLSTIIGHVSSSTTLNIYAHVTDEMRRTAAVKIDQGIGKTELQAESQSAPRNPAPSTFQAHKGQRRKEGTGCGTQINEKLWEGRYSPIWPDGKKRPRNIYTHSEEECEKLLAEMIVEMKTEIAAERERLKAGYRKSTAHRVRYPLGEPFFSVCGWLCVSVKPPRAWTGMRQ